jgi:uncharacterized protein (DUF885 family)
MTDREGCMTAAGELADRVHRRWLEENPFAASMYGIPGYDDLVPDESEEGRQAWRAEAGQFLREAGAIAGGQLTAAEAVTLDCTKQAAAQELEIIDLAGAEYTVTAMPYAGPAAFLAVAARTVLVDPAAAEAYLTRLRRSGGWLDRIGERLRTGSGRGRLPVAPLAEQAIGWAEGVLAAPGTSPVLSPQPPQGWRKAAAWEEERRAVAEEVVHPALARWVATVRELLRRAGHRGGPDWPTCPAARRITPGRSGSIRPCRCPPESSTRPAWTTSRRWRPGPSSWAPAWGCPGWTRYSPPCGTRLGRFLRRRPCAWRRPR